MNLLGLVRPGYSLTQIDMNVWYKIRVRGQLDESWAEWFEGMAIEHTAEKETVLQGNVCDQAALYGMLNKLRNLGLELLDVERIVRKKQERKKVSPVLTH